MANLIVLDDFSTNKKIYVVFVESDFLVIDDFWEDPNTFLPEVGKLISNDTCKTWSDLSVNHWKVLSAFRMTEVMNLDTMDQQNEQHPMVMSFHFFLKGLIYSIERSICYRVDQMNIQKIGDSTFNFTMTGSDCVSMPGTSQKKPDLVVLPGAGT